MNLKFEDIINK